MAVKNTLVLLANFALVHQALGKVQYAGVNIAGFDFGCGYTNGSYTASGVTPPLSSQGGPDGAGQMSHFNSAYGLNLFRLPVCWQYLVNDQLGGDLDSNNFGIYQELVSACTSTGASCIVDIHNYARWNNQIVGQSNGAVTNEDLVSTWTQLATEYASNQQIIFGVMNEPHDLDIDTWAQTVQEVVTAIRNAGATSQLILLPGTSYTGLGAYISDGSYAALSNITNPDGSTTGLIFDVHQYLDSDGSGTHVDCTTDGTSNIANLAAALQSSNRQALLSETGGGNSDSCVTDVCAELTALNNNSDVFLGWAGWAAGSFATDYVLSEVPTESNGQWTDTEIVSQCVGGLFASS